MPKERKLVAYLLPIGLFVALMALNDTLKTVGGGVLLTRAEFWVYPVQTILCSAVLIWFRREYGFSRPRSVAIASLAGVVAFLIWISPQQFLGFPARMIGFNPMNIFGNPSLLYWPTVIFRFLRLVVVAPFVEEIFWRGFLLRFLINENFERVAFGTFSWFSFAVVSLGFGLSHSAPDWTAGVLTGVLYNCIAYRAKRLSSCILAHAITNLLLGLWIMETQQWGFW